MTESPIWRRPRSILDGEWEARYVLDTGPPKRVGLVIEQETADGTIAFSMPLTGRRTRALIGLLQDLLEEAEEATAEPGEVSVTNPGRVTQIIGSVHSPKVSLKSK